MAICFCRVFDKYQQRHESRTLTFIDTIFGARPLTYFLLESGQVRMIDGGSQIIEPLVVANNGSVEAYTGSGPIDPTQENSQQFSAAEFDWSTIVASISITGIEEAKNAGSNRILDLLEGKIAVARESITEFMNTAFHLDTATAPAANFNGLGYLVAQNTNSVGGILTTDGAGDAPGQTYWQSHIDSDAVALSTADMTTVYNTVSVGNDQPNLVLTTQALYEKYESLLQPQLRYSSADVADAGFQNLMFKGAPVLYDADTTAGVMYMLNTKYLKLVGHSDKWFTPSPFIRTTVADSRTAQIFCYGQLTINNRNRQGVLTAKTV